MWALVVISTISITHKIVDVDTKTYYYNSNSECVMAMAQYKPGKNNIRAVLCRKVT